jgi:amidase
VKDLADVQGLPTTSGLFPLPEAPVAEHDDVFVARIRSAGAVFIGKTNTPELGLGSHTYNTVAPTTGNVADPALSAGGSSGGAAVAVACGMVPVADGSDFMGSLRNPPGWNGVLGLRPTPGVVLDADDDPAAPGSGVNGPIARSVAELAALLTTMAGPGYAFAAAPTDPLPRIGWLGDLDGALPLEPGIGETCTAALKRWSPDVEDAHLEEPEGLWPLWLVVRHQEVGGALLESYPEVERARMKPEAQWEIEGARRLTSGQIQEAQHRRRALRDEVLGQLERFDMLALPTAQVWPFPVEQHWPESVAGVPMDTYHRWMQVTTLATLTGLPVLAVPAGVNQAGLSIGLQLIGRPNGEQQLLSFAVEAERREVFVVLPPSVAAD